MRCNVPAILGFAGKEKFDLEQACLRLAWLPRRRQLGEWRRAGLTQVNAPHKPQA
jgi:hypothetical protein